MYGSATIEPSGPVKVAQCCEWRIKYIVGKTGLSQRGGLVLVVPKAGFSSPKFFPPDEPRQRVDNSLTGYTTVELSRRDARAVLSLENPPHSSGYGLSAAGGEGFIWPGSTVYLRVAGADLQKGDLITFTYGDRCSGSAGAVSGTYACRAKFSVCVEPDGALSGPCAGYYEARGDLRIDVLSDKATKLVVIAPSVVKCGDVADVRVVPRDLFENLDSDYDGEVRLSDPDGRRRSCAATARKRGVITFTGVNVSDQASPNFIIAEDARGLKTRSNPVLVTENPDAPKIFWGDVHVHTELCDGLGTLNEAYEYARDVAGIDFAAIATHDTLCDSRDWAAMQKAVEDHEEAGCFVPFLAYEYSERKVGGDKTVLFKGNDEEIFRCVDDGSRTPEELWEKLRGKQVITMPHSGAHRSMGTNWEHHHPELQRLVEIYSEWGNSEYPGNPRPVTWDHQRENRPARPGGTVQEGLLTGARVGIMASSDNHSGQPGYSDQMGSFARRRAYHGGLAAVYADALTRAEIWDGLWNRRCYGTTGARIVLDFLLNGRPMGSEIALDSLRRDERKIVVLAAGTERIQRVDVVRNNQNIFSYEGGGEAERFEFVDSEPIEPLLLTGIHSPAPFIYYYVRVTQADGEMAWSSPIWVSK